MTNAPVNPFKALRERQGISQYELARRTGVSKHAILRLEQGTYPNPLPTILNYFTDKSHSRPTLEKQYADFQIFTRELNARLLGDLIPELMAYNPTTHGHPLTYLRTNRGINPTELAKRLCISQSVVVRFEKRSVHQHTVPDQLITALHDADYTELETAALSEAYATFRDYLSTQQDFKLVTS